MQKYTFPVFTCKSEVLLKTTAIDVYINVPGMPEIRRLIALSYPQCQIFGFENDLLNDQPTLENLMIVVGDRVAIMPKQKRLIKKFMGTPNSFVQTSILTIYGDPNNHIIDKLIPGGELMQINRMPNNTFSLVPYATMEDVIVFVNA